MSINGCGVPWASFKALMHIALYEDINLAEDINPSNNEAT